MLLDLPRYASASEHQVSLNIVTFDAKRAARILQWGVCVGGLGAPPPATENFRIFTKKKVNCSAFDCIICCNNVSYILFKYFR